jgi:hypothetical protein
MFFYSRFAEFKRACIKKAGLKTVSINKITLFVFLLMPSMVLQAEFAEPSELQVAPRVDDMQAGDKQEQPFMFPQWPERKQVNREVIPLPPPGPYMSSALSDFSIKGRSFDRGDYKDQLNTSAVDSNLSTIPGEKFSPDRPWPKNFQPAKRWMPETGYRFIKPDINKHVYSKRMPAQWNNYNYWYAPVPNRQASRDIAPSTGNAPYMPGYYSPGNGSRYYDPNMNRYNNRSTSPMDRL